MNQPPETPEPMRLGDFVTPSKTLDPISFEEQHGSAFLLHHGPIGKLKKPDGINSTIAAEGSRTSPDRPFNPQVDFVVFPVKGKPGGQEEDVVWAGRSETNDIVIPDASVSAVHAFFRRDSSGGFFLQDMNSMNGTFVDDEQVPAQGMGGAIDLRSGARVILGSVALSFLHATEFRTLIARLTG